MYFNSGQAGESKNENVHFANK